MQSHYESNLRIITGGWIAIRSAFFGSAILATCIAIGIPLIDVFTGGLPVLMELGFSQILYNIFITFILVSVSTFVICVIPAFVAGLYLARKCRQVAIIGKLTVKDGTRFGFFTGLLAGVILSTILLAFYTPLAMLPVHNLPPPPLVIALVNSASWIPFIIIPSLAVGAYTGNRLAKTYIGEITSGPTPAPPDGFASLRSARRR